MSSRKIPRITNHNQVYLAVQEAIHLYNTDRPHLSFNIAVPKEIYYGADFDISPIVIPDIDLCIT